MCVSAKESLQDSVWFPTFAPGLLSPSNPPWANPNAAPPPPSEPKDGARPRSPEAGAGFRARFGPPRLQRRTDPSSSHPPSDNPGYGASRKGSLLIATAKKTPALGSTHFNPAFSAASLAVALQSMSSMPRPMAVTKWSRTALAKGSGVSTASAAANASRRSFSPKRSLNPAG